jgi:hypothetical protein
VDEGLRIRRSVIDAWILGPFIIGFPSHIPLKATDLCGHPRWSASVGPWAFGCSQLAPTKVSALKEKTRWVWGVAGPWERM